MVPKEDIKHMIAAVSDAVRVANGRQNRMNWDHESIVIWGHDVHESVGGFDCHVKLISTVIDSSDMEAMMAALGATSWSVDTELEDSGRYCPTYEIVTTVTMKGCPIRRFPFPGYIPV